MLENNAIAWLRYYTLVNRFWALRIRPMIFSSLHITQEKSKLFLDFVRLHSIKPSIRLTVQTLYIFVGSLAVTGSNSWYHEILNLISDGVFPNLRLYMLEDCETPRNRHEQIRPSYDSGELQLRQILSHCTPVPDKNCARWYRGHRSRTLGSFLDYIDAEDSSKIWCEDVKWLKKITPSEAFVLAGRRGYRSHRFDATRWLIVENCSAAWPFLLFLITTEQPPSTFVDFPVYIHPSELLWVLKLFECFMDKCSCLCCYRPSGIGPSKGYYLQGLKSRSESGTSLETIVRYLADIMSTDTGIARIVARVKDGHRLFVVVEPSGFVSKIELVLHIDAIAPFKRVQDLAFLAQLERHADAIGGASREVTIEVEGMGFEMRKFMRAACHYMPRLTLTGQLRFSRKSGGKMLESYGLINVKKNLTSH